MITITNEDNMELMARYPDNHFELAIVDPPYGIGMHGRGKGDGTLTKHKWKQHKVKDWDNNPPEVEYFKELFRVSKNQIVWGANHFIELMAKNSSCWIIWDKMQVFSLADFELAWTSFTSPCRAFRFTRAEATNEKKGQAIHPTQKPIALYEWLLNKYAKEGDKILDTHLGSGSIAIACDKLGFDLTACELDIEYYEAALNRLKRHQTKGDELKNLGYAKSELEKINPTLF